MSKEFIEERRGSYDLNLAVDQHKQLQYFTQSEIQKDITTEYLSQWAAREYRTHDYFLNFVKTIFKTENFLSFFKYLRNPNPSAGLINDAILPALSRVFYSEDSYFKYVIKGQEVSEPENLHCAKFRDEIFRAILFRHNDILIHDMDGINSPFRDLISIENVVAIESSHSQIHRVAYSGKANINGEDEKGYIYMDSDKYQFYNKDFELLLDVPHDLGECPADYIVPYAFSDQDVVRKSIFSYVREKLEEYTFLKTLQRLTEPNAAFPITVKLKTQEKKKDESNSVDSDVLPLSSGKIPNKQTGSPLQAGSVISVAALPDDSGKINMDMVDKFFKFIHAPVEILEFINNRIKQVEDEITLRILGDFKERNEEAMNRTQVKKGYVSAEDRLRVVSKILSRITTISDRKMLSLQYGKDSVEVDNFFGSDFFLDTEQDLYDLFEKSPNTIERKNILKKISSTRYKFNREKKQREAILYDLIPFVSDKDFTLAKESLPPEVIQLQTRFNYWISRVEAEFGDIVELWEIMGEVPNSQKLIFLSNLVENYIKDYVKSISSNNQDNSLSEREE